MEQNQQIKRHQQLTNIGILIGLALVWGTAFLIKPKDPPGNEVWLLLSLRLLGVGFFIWGCRHYAMSKGRHPAWGWLGLLNIIGLIVLVLLGNRASRRS
ncbi:MAG: hypothetical protein ACYC26_06970 [Phycisphaerales bacterium]